MRGAPWPTWWLAADPRHAWTTRGRQWGHRGRGAPGRHAVAAIRWAYYDDPDGNTAELQVDNFADEAEGQAFFRQAGAEAPAMLRGKVLDRRVQAGATARELHERSSTGEFTPESAGATRL